LQASAARFFAAAAGVGAFLAVLHVGMLGALVAAGFANLGTLAQQVLGVFGATSHEAGGQVTNVGAVTVELNAAGHHLYVVFLQAGRSTVFTGINAGIQRRQQALVLRMHRG